MRGLFLWENFNLDNEIAFRFSGYILKAMYDVITIGTAMRDVFVRLGMIPNGRYHRVVRNSRFETGAAECFSLGSKIAVPDIVFATGGGGTNAAVTFAREGLKTACFSIVGGDVNGETVMRELHKERVDFLFKIDRHARHKTAYGIILLSFSGERTILTYRGASEDLKHAAIPWPRLKARWLYLAPLGGAARGAIERTLRHARAARMNVAVNPSLAMIGDGLAEATRLFRGVKVFIVNEEEAALLARARGTKPEKLLAALVRAFRTLVVVTRGPRGVLVGDGKRIYRAGTYRERSVADRTGAGDAFGSGFVSALIRGGKEKDFASADIEEAIRLGSANGTSVVEHIGAKEGILTRSAFLHEKRWQGFPVTVRRA